MRNCKVLVILGFLLIAPLVANACPYCGYSPNGWGFCKYGRFTGAWACTDIVVDSFSGKTGCDLCGACDWNNPSNNRGCVSTGDDEGCGLSYPCDQSLKAPDLLVPSCGRPSRISSGNDLNWIDAPVDQVVIF